MNFHPSLGKVHFQPETLPGGYRLLFCSGRSVFLAQTSSKLDDVNCKSCRRRLVSSARKAA